VTSGTAREALVAELLGDTERMLDRIDAVMPKLEAATARMEVVAATIPEATEAATKWFSKSVGEIGNVAKQDIVAVTNRNAKTVFLAQAAELKVEAKGVFDEQVTPPLRQLTSQLHAAIRQSQNSWGRWATHAATAVLAAFLPTALLLPLIRPALANEHPTAEAPACVQPAPASADPATAPLPQKPRARR
jgi:hypothetical protein